jgi:hypothetical protein
MHVNIRLGLEISLWLSFGVFSLMNDLDQLEPDFQSLFYTLIGFPTLLKNCFHDELSTALVHIKSHVQSVKKGKKECAPWNVLANIPGFFKTRYIDDFQSAFIYTLITISMDPWEKLPVEDVQELFSAVFSEVNHKIVFGDMFHSPVTCRIGFPTSVCADYVL